MHSFLGLIAYFKQLAVTLPKHQHWHRYLKQIEAFPVCSLVKFQPHRVELLEIAHCMKKKRLVPLLHGHNTIVVTYPSPTPCITLLRSTILKCA